MKDPTTAPTAELLAELMNLEKGAKTRPVSLECVYARQVKAKRHSDICYELDSRTVGMNLMDGMPEISIDHVSILKQMTLPPKPVAIKINIPIDELIERLKWLQIKGGK